ncbi:aminotransferase-like domain-containing protein [Paenibacillus sp. 481]|uniref:aminotransferase-like domain-containing protein n=1 Tax=Paenibacillus sp. 481 TaxID=2835869 RepID=UPI001E308A5C|nr:PLP-dependent aminotransferase family protein [Paenibacillus sp. 481]UHA75764.1 PLP-dependent aminotransferase family protein [Paenibacillus sp. 481]
MQRSLWQPDRHASEPLYKQIEQHIKQKIIAGEWTVGMKLPSQRTLASWYQTNRSTIVTAMEELMAQGLIAGNSGGGTRIVNDAWNLLASTAPPDWESYVKSGIHHPNLPAIQQINEAEFRSGVIRLGTGELSPDLLPQADMQNVLRKLAAAPLKLGYEEPKGDLVLRQLLSERLRAAHIHASPASILIVSGALQALQLIAVGLLQHGASIMLERPSYLYSVHVFQSAGMRMHGIPMDEHGIDVSVLPHIKKQCGGALLYTIPTFQNPTGTVMSDERRDQLVAACSQIGLPIIEDAAYEDLWLESPAPPALKARDKHGSVLYVGSMSKTVSPGLRLGWVVGTEPVIQRLADIKMQTDYGSSSLSQQAAATWLASGMHDEHLARLRAALRVRRDAVLRSLEQHFSGLAEWSIPQGGFYIWLRIRPHLSMRELFDRALHDGIVLNPGHLYDRSAKPYLRISYAYASMEELETGLRKLARHIHNLGRVTT